jgi:uncharacterized membrane protein YeaQ/YmgE (transglycosylase-associated protein family)
MRASHSKSSVVIEIAPTNPSNRGSFTPLTADGRSVLQPGLLDSLSIEWRDGHSSNARNMHQRRRKMIFIVWLIAGGLIGWLASSIMRPEAAQGAALDVIVGVVGAVLGGWLIAPLFGVGNLHQNDFSAAGLMSSLLGAVVLLAVVNLVRRGGVR